MMIQKLGDEGKRGWGKDIQFSPILYCTSQDWSVDLPLLNTDYVISYYGKVFGEFFIH